MNIDKAIQVITYISYVITIITEIFNLVNSCLKYKNHKEWKVYKQLIILISFQLASFIGVCMDLASTVSELPSSAEKPY
jgi:NADH:ubiquinone oxidoreductase subunit 6 (subunit J)